MRLLHSISFPDLAISWAGVGSDPDLYWWIAAGDSPDDRKARVGRIEGGDLKVLGTIEPVGRRAIVRFTRDNAALLVSDGETLHRLSLARGGATSDFNIHDSSVTHLDSQDGRVVFFARSLGWPPIRRVDIERDTIEYLEPQRHEVSKHYPLLALSPDGRHLAFGHVFDAIEIFELADSTSTPWPQSAGQIPVLQLQHSDMLARLDFTPDGEYVIAVSHPRSHDDPHILRIGAISGQEVHAHPLVNHLPIVGVAPGGQWVAAASRHRLGRVDVFDPMTGAIKASVDIHRPVKALALDQKAERLTIVHAGGVDICVD